MNIKNYNSLLRYAKLKVKHNETAEDLLHDSIVTALEKNQIRSGFVARIFDNHKRTYFRNLDIQKRNNEKYYYDELSINSPINYGEALDITKAINTITNYIRRSPTFNYRADSKNSQDIFIDYYLWKKDSNELAKKYNSSPKSIRNLSYIFANRVRAIKVLKPYLDFIDEQKYTSLKTESFRNKISKRLRYNRKIKCT